MIQLLTEYLFMIPAPTGVEPVKPTFLISGWSQIACPATDPKTQNKYNDDIRKLY